MKNYLTVLGLVGVITAAIVIFVMRGEAARSKRLTEETQAVGFVATPVEWWDGEENQEGHTLTFAWVDARGAVHPQTMKEISWYDQSTTYKVCYNPQDAADWKLYPADHVCGS
ncbi:hypothetical protein [Longimicrobium sp.]|uniref:hypothetical protein n=1 Tax=Longimicrobium sp. TaxID=2029185 RepID=UPI002E33E353|nr:hypothetical protein [Longimicrobium sp.]HEX6039576.1 hypothetical protein [Longimicrobium sp.]